MAGVTVWQIDPAHTTIEFAVRHMMFTTVRGRFKSFSGSIRVDEEQPDRSTASVEIDATSIDTGVNDRDGHLRSPDFLDVANHPKMTFQSTRVSCTKIRPGERFDLQGELTIRGKTLPVTLKTTFEGVGRDPWGNERAGFAATGEIDRRDWGLTWNQPLETGGILVAHGVKIEVEVQVIKQSAVAAAQAS